MNDNDLLTTCEGENIWAIFHRIWGMAKDSPSYDKQALQILEAKIFSLQTTIKALIQSQSK